MQILEAFWIWQRMNVNCISLYSKYFSYIRHKFPPSFMKIMENSIFSANAHSRVDRTAPTRSYWAAHRLRIFHRANSHHRARASETAIWKGLASTKVIQTTTIHCSTVVIEPNERNANMFKSFFLYYLPLSFNYPSHFVIKSNVRKNLTENNDPNNSIWLF